MSVFDDRAKSLAYWEWLRTANPWLPPFHRLSTASFNLNISTRDLEMKVVVDWPAEPFRFDPWDGQMAASDLLTGPDMWNDLLSTAISCVASVISQTGTPRIDHGRLVYAAQAIRAMAPEGTKWHVSRPSPVGHERERLRAVVRLLLEADQYDSDELRRDRLALAESHLHDLWISAKEES